MIKKKCIIFTLETNALNEDGYLIINTEPLNYQYDINPEYINMANQKSIEKAWYPIEGCLWEIRVCKENGEWMGDRFDSEVKIAFPYHEDRRVIGNALIALEEESLEVFCLNEEHIDWQMIPGSNVDKANNVGMTLGLATFGSSK